jgi:signal transduction histidine kinase
MFAINALYANLVCWRGIISVAPRCWLGQPTLVLSDMRDAVTRANVIIRELLQLSAATDFKPKDEDLNGLVEHSLLLINSEIVAAQVKAVRSLDAELPPVRLDRTKVEQVFINLFINAAQAMSQGGVLTVTTRHRRFGEDGAIDIRNRPLGGVMVTLLFSTDLEEKSGWVSTP